MALPTETTTKIIIAGSRRWRKLTQPITRFFVERGCFPPTDTFTSSHHRIFHSMALLHPVNPPFSTSHNRHSKRQQNTIQLPPFDENPPKIAFANGILHNRQFSASPTSLFNDFGSLFSYPEEEEYNRGDKHFAMMQELRRREELHEREEGESRDQTQQQQQQIGRGDMGEQRQQQTRPLEFERNNQEQEKGVYLDPETYSRAESLALDDGSLDFDLTPSSTETSSRYYRNPNKSRGRNPPKRIQSELYKKAVEGLLSPAPSYSYRSNNGEERPQKQQQQRQQPQLSDEDLLLEAVSKLNSIDTTGANNPEAETLHQLVFAEEETYLNQSLEFRKSLSSYYGRNGVGNIGDNDDGNGEESQVESPIAKQRRLAIEAYNNKVLEQLLKDMEEIEEMAPTREEALRMAAFSTSFDSTAHTSGSRAATAPQEATDTEMFDEIERPESDQKNSTTDFDKGNPVLCYKCGGRVTPEVMERARMLERYNNKNTRILCQACHGMQFRLIEEAEVRLATGYLNNFNYPSSPSSSSVFWERRRGSYDNKNRRERWTNGGESVMTSDRSNSRFDKSRGNVKEGSGSNNQKTSNSDMMDTSPKKGYSNHRVGNSFGATNRKPMIASRTESLPKEKHHDDPSRKMSREEAKKGMWQQKMIPRNTSSRPEKKHLEKRRSMEAPSKEHYLENPKSNINNTTTDFRQSDEGTNNINNKGQWKKVTDPKTKRMFYWNRETGEMKRRLSE